MAMHLPTHLSVFGDYGPKLPSHISVFGDSCNMQLQPAVLAAPPPPPADAGGSQPMANRWNGGSPGQLEQGEHSLALPLLSHLLIDLLQAVQSLYVVILMKQCQVILELSCAGTRAIVHWDFNLTTFFLKVIELRLFSGWEGAAGPGRVQEEAAQQVVRSPSWSTVLSAVPHLPKVCFGAGSQLRRPASLGMTIRVPAMQLSPPAHRPSRLVSLGACGCRGWWVVWDEWSCRARLTCGNTMPDAGCGPDHRHHS